MFSEPLVIEQTTQTADTLLDSFGRFHDYLRISLTDSCNLRCIYCMPEEDILTTPSAAMMQREEILELATLFVSLGVKKIRLTGGEPLVRKDFAQILGDLATLPLALSVSTNGVLVDKYLDAFREAKLSSINVSLDSLKTDEFQKITQRNSLPRVVSNIELLMKEEFRLKINMVVLRDVNDSAVMDFVEWTKDRDIEVRFIEFMPFQGNDWGWKLVYPSTDLLKRIAETYSLEKIVDEPNDTARKYRVTGHRGSFGFISTMSHPFCSGCNRLRLTCDGKLKNCLLAHSEVDLLSALRSGKDIHQLIATSVRAKARERGGLISFENVVNRSMIQIGG